MKQIICCDEMAEEMGSSDNGVICEELYDWHTWITYGDHKVCEIRYCPWCGKKIEYKEE